MIARAFVTFAVGMLLAAPSPSAAQSIPIVNLPPAAATTPTSMGSVIGVRQIANGRVLVNDGVARRLTVFDSTLRATTVVLDSTPGTSTYYGPYRAVLMPFVADSCLFADYSSRSMLVLDPTGRMARAMALLNSNEPPIRPALNPGGVDDRGRVLYLSPIRTEAGLGAAADSVSVIRVNLETRRVDTVARLNRNPTRVFLERAANGTPIVTLVTNPFIAIDEWAVLTDGSIAIVRGSDYHIDWIRPDGRAESTPRMPFDWRRLFDEDKQKLIDSARSAMAATVAPTTVGAAPPRGNGRGGSGDDGAANPGMLKRELVSPKSIADFYPAIRAGATLPDRDGNLWILPATSTRSLQGELIYDVVNVKGELFQRVRAPIGRAIVGFGGGGVVYLVSGNAAAGFRLERTRLAAGARTPGR